MGFWRKVGLTTLVLLGYAALFPSQLFVADWPTALIGAVILGVFNGVLRPIAKLLTLPLTILTLGLFLLVLNGLMLTFMTWFVPGILFTSFTSTVVVATIISVVNMLFGEPRRT